MIIKVDKEGFDAIMVLCDATLHAQGLHARDLINTVLTSMTSVQENPVVIPTEVVSIPSKSPK